MSCVVFSRKMRFNGVQNHEEVCNFHWLFSPGVLYFAAELFIQVAKGRKKLNSR